MKYFFGVAPPPLVLERIEALRTRWGNPHHRVEPHVTVKDPFPLDDEPEPLLRTIGLACTSVNPFDLQLGAPARFGGNGVLYLTVQGEGIRVLHATVLSGMGKLAPAPGWHEGDAYTPHLTLAVRRFGIDDAGLDRMEAEARAELTGFAPFVVRSLVCYRREPSEPWSRYAELPLGG